MPSPPSPFVVLATVLVACAPSRGAAPPASSAPPARPAPPAPAATLDVEVIAEEPVRGRLVLGYRTPAEQADVEAHGLSLALVRKMIERWELGDDVDFAAVRSVHVTIPGAPPDAVAVVMLERDHTFWETLVGGGRGLVGVGRKGETVRLAPNPPRPPSPEPCSGERYRLLTIEAPELASTPRRFCAWLPKSWATAPTRRYPIVLLFPGFMSTDTSYLRGRDHLGVRLDALGREAVLVGVDTSTPLGSTYLEDSPATGPWDTFLTARAIPRLDRELRGHGSRAGRAVIGQSTGGFNTLSFGMRHSDLFAALGASSPDPPDFEGWIAEPGTRRARDWVRRWLRIEDAVGGAGQMTSWAATWSPAVDGGAQGARRGPRWPLDPETGRIDEDVLARWTAGSPHGRMRDAAFAARARKDLHGRILVTVGRNDEFGLFEPAERFAKELDVAGLAPTFVPTEDGHGNERARLETALRFVLDRMEGLPRPSITR